MKMKKKEWKEKYKDKIKEFEEQNTLLNKMVKKAIEKVEKANADTLFEVLSEITNVFNEYFGMEERNLQVVGYPELETHAMAHRAFVKKILYFRGGSDESLKKLSKKIVAFLKQWQTTHVMGSDKAYAPFVRIHLYLKAVQ